MSKIAVVVDSTSSIPQPYIDRYSLYIAPNTLYWDGIEYRDNIDMTPDTFCERIKDTRTYPKTAAVSPAYFLSLFKDLLAQDLQVLCLVPSQKISRIGDSALEARDMIEGSSDRIAVIDSQTAGMAQGWLAIKAAEVASKGVSLQSLESAVRSAIPHTGYFGTVDTLDFLLRAGRIGRARHFLGSTLNVRPILDMVDGEAFGLTQVRTRRKAIQKLLDILEERVAGQRPLYLAVMHVCVESDAQLLLKEASARLNPDEAVLASFTPNPSVQQGPGALGFNYLAGVADLIA